MPKSLVIKLSKTCEKKKILKSAKERKRHYVHRNKDKDDSRLVNKKIQALQQWNNIFNVLKQILSLYPVDTSFKKEGKINFFFRHTTV